MGTADHFLTSSSILAFTPSYSHFLSLLSAYIWRSTDTINQISRSQKKNPTISNPLPQTLSMVVSSQTKREEQSPCGYHLFIYYKSKHKLLPELHNCLTLQGNDIPAPFTGD